MKTFRSCHLIINRSIMMIIGASLIIWMLIFSGVEVLLLHFLNGLQPLMLTFLPIAHVGKSPAKISTFAVVMDGVNDAGSRATIGAQTS